MNIWIFAPCAVIAVFVALGAFLGGIYAWIFGVLSILGLAIEAFYFKSRFDNLLQKFQKEELHSQELSKHSKDDIVIEEMIDVLEKLKIGFLGYEITNIAQDPKNEQIKNLLNSSMKKLNDDLDYALKILTEYGNANFAFAVDTKNLSGKTGSLILSIRALGSSISELIALISKTAEELNADILVLSKSSSNLSIASNQQAASLEQTAAALEEIIGTISNNTANSAKMATYASEVKSSATKGNELARKTFESMDQINSEVNAINEAIGVIDQIAFQTNILSLNAAVEAATAGEAGKGFAVVAGEVRNLANKSADAAKQIKKLVDSATQKAHLGKNISVEMINGYETLNNHISQTMSLIDDVTNSAKEQQAGIEQINDVVMELDQATQHNAMAANDISEMAKAIEHLSAHLIYAAQKSKFDTKALEQVDDMELTMYLNRLKLDHINFKNNNCAKLGTKNSWKVATEHDCNLGKWIDESERANKIFTKSSNWKHLKEVHANVHGSMQKIIDENASKTSSNVILADEAHKLDQSISDVFWTIQETKRENK